MGFENKITSSCAASKVYCSEQIHIPNSLPSILKVYAKAAIRTQPQDILLWSATYFRCLANNVPPPERIHLEKGCQQKTLTKGYIKAIVKKIGKSFFVSRCILQEIWTSFCLPTDDLLKYLSCCGMLKDSYIHWMYLLTLMVESITSGAHETMITLCEVLSDDIEGGPARVPYWMFKICYSFWSSRKEQNITKDNIGSLQFQKRHDIKTAHLPRILSSSELQSSIIAKCREKLANASYKGCLNSSNLKKNSEVTNDICNKLEVLLVAIKDECPASKSFKSHCRFADNLQKAQQVEDVEEEVQENAANEILKNSQRFAFKECSKLLGNGKGTQNDFNKFLLNKCNFTHYECTESHRETYSNVQDVDTCLENATKDTCVHDSSTSCSLSINVSSKSTCSSTNSLENLLYKKKSDDQFEGNLNAREIELIATLELGKSEGKLNLEKPKTVAAFLENETVIAQTLENADKKGLRFTSALDVIVYLRNKLSIDKEKKEANFQEPSDNIERVLMEFKDVLKEPDIQETVSEEKQTEADAITKVFEVTITASEKTQKPDTQTLSRSLQILGLASPILHETPEVIADVVSSISESGEDSNMGNHSDDSSIFPSSPCLTKPIGWKCLETNTQVKSMQPKQYKSETCETQSRVTAETVEQFLSYLKFRSLSQRGFVMPKNFIEEDCPNMTDP